MTLSIYRQSLKQTFNEIKALNHEVLKNISVKSPYFSLENLVEAEEYIYCEFNAELEKHEELTPITTAEVGRHMAILGSVVLAKHNPRKERHHYLATDAIIKRVSHNSPDNPNLSARAKVASFNRKRGTIEGILYDSEHKPLFEVEVGYMILHHKIFERMFAENKIESSGYINHGNPYTSVPEFTSCELDIESCKASIGIVKPEDCPGHFNNYPALPVARLGTSMGRIAGLHFLHLNPDCEKYTIYDVVLKANQLIFPGEKVNFRTEITNMNLEKGMEIKTIVYTDKVDNIAHCICRFY